VDNTRAIQKMNETKDCFSEKINRIDTALAKLTKSKREREDPNFKKTEIPDMLGKSFKSLFLNMIKED
jgi:hypothetical protein